MYKNAFKYIRNIMIINVITIVFMFMASYLTNSIALLAFAIDKSLDTLSNIISMVGIGIAARTADTDHQYGHAKFEVISRFILSLILFLSVIQIIANAVNRLFFKRIVPTMDPLSFQISIAVMILLVSIFFYARRGGRITGVKTLTAESYNYLTDIFSLTIVISGVYLSSFGLYYIDPIIAIVISFLILKLGWEIFEESIGVLTDKAVLDIESIKKFVESYPKVINCHGIATRTDGYHSYLEFHMVVDSKITVEDAHNLAHEIEEAIKNKFKEYNFKQVTIHIEPESVLKDLKK